MACTINNTFSFDGANIDNYLLSDFESISSDWSDFECNEHLHSPQNISYDKNAFNICDLHMCNTIDDIEQKYNFNDHIVLLSDCKDFENITSNKINKTQIIPSKHLRWWIKVPVQINQSKRIWIRMLADSAADKPCANLHWA